MMMLLQENSITIYYDNENHCIVAEWKGYQTVDSIRSGCEKIIEFLKNYKARKILYDNTKVEGIWSGASEWVGSVWFSELVKNDLLKFAWICSTSAFSRFSTDEAIKHIQNKDLIKTFDQKPEAIEWLKNNEV